jgi:hypothetical protein
MCERVKESFFNHNHITHDLALTIFCGKYIFPFILDIFVYDAVMSGK